MLSHHLLSPLQRFIALGLLLAASVAPLPAAIEASLTARSVTAAEANSLLRPSAPAPDVAPPTPLFSPELSPVGQTNFLGAAFTPPDQLTLYAFYGITNVWSTVATRTITQAPTAIAPALEGFILTYSDGSREHVQIDLAKRLIGWIDWAVIFVYLAGMAGVGWYCYRRESRASTTGYFLAGRDIPGWAAGLSLYATGTSAISFIAIPAKSFATDWLYLGQSMIGLAGTVYVAFKIVPLIRRLGLTSVYHYLEMRFHPSVRVMGSALQVVFQLVGRMSIVLFLPALAIANVAGVSVVTSVILMGIVTTIYTFLGGMKAVIWTDVIQVFVMIGGALFAIGYIIYGIDGGLSAAWQIARDEEKMHTFDWAWQFTIPTVWAFLLLETFNVLTWPKDQVMMQRVLSTRDDKGARNSVLTLAAVVLPGNLLFYSIGTALFVFYQTHPEKLNPLLATDATFPHFIAAELPVGVTGLIIAGLFAASMSTLSSGLNSVATMVSVDFYERFRPGRDAPGAKIPGANRAGTMRVATWVTLLAGILSTIAAVLLSFFDIKSLFDVSLRLTAVLGGGFAGCYALGMFTRRANWQGSLIGTGASIIFATTMGSQISPILQTGFAIATCIIVGYLASWFFPPPAQSLAGLTIFTPRGRAPEPET